MRWVLKERRGVVRSARRAARCGVGKGAMQMFAGGVWGRRAQSQPRGLPTGRDQSMQHGIAF
jgi:hypothetical protein